MQFAGGVQGPTTLAQPFLLPTDCATFRCFPLWLMVRTGHHGRLKICSNWPGLALPMEQMEGITRLRRTSSTEGEFTEHFRIHDKFYRTCSLTSLPPQITAHAHRLASSSGKRLGTKGLSNANSITIYVPLSIYCWNDKAGWHFLSLKILRAFS